MPLNIAQRGTRGNNAVTIASSWKQPLASFSRPQTHSVPFGFTLLDRKNPTDLLCVCEAACCQVSARFTTVWQTSVFRSVSDIVFHFFKKKKENVFQKKLVLKRKIWQVGDSAVWACTVMARRPLSIWRLCWRTSFSLLTLWNVNLALLRQDPSKAFTESVLTGGFCGRFQQCSRKESGEQPFFLWGCRGRGCTQHPQRPLELGAEPVQPLSWNHIPGGPTWRPWSHREGSRWHLAPPGLEFWELHLGERKLSRLFCLPWCCGQLGTQPSKRTGSSPTSHRHTTLDQVPQGRVNPSLSLPTWWQVSLSGSSCSRQTARKLTNDNLDSVMLGEGELFVWKKKTPQALISGATSQMYKDTLPQSRSDFSAMCTSGPGDAQLWPRNLWLKQRCLGGR